MGDRVHEMSVLDDTNSDRTYTLQETADRIMTMLDDTTAPAVGAEESVKPGLRRPTSDDFISEFDDIIDSNEELMAEVPRRHPRCVRSTSPKAESTQGDEELMAEDTPLGKMVGKLHVSPPELLFSVREGLDSQCEMTLNNTSGKDPIAFKIKTTNLRRYHVKPNQGIIPPKGSVTLQITMAKEHTKPTARCKDLFLVQGVPFSMSNPDTFQWRKHITAKLAENVWELKLKVVYQDISSPAWSAALDKDFDDFESPSRSPRSFQTPRSKHRNLVRLDATVEYEFTDKQNIVFDKLTGMIKHAALIFFLMFVVTSIEVFVKIFMATKGEPPDVASMSDAVDYFMYAYFLNRTSGSFVRVTTTQGCDITNLIEALNELYLLFKRMSFVSTIYVLKTAAMILLQFPAVIRQIDQVKQYFQDSQTSGTEEMTESQLEITEVLATAIVLVATTLLTAVAFIGVFIDRRGMVTEA